MTLVRWSAFMCACVLLSAPLAGHIDQSLQGCQTAARERTLSVVTIRTGSLAGGASECFGLALARGEYGRIVIGAEVGYVRARVLAPDGRQLQQTWASSFATAAPSLPLAIEAGETGLHVVEVSVPSWVSFNRPQAFTVQLTAKQTAGERAARREAILQDARVEWLRQHARQLRSIDPGDSDYADLEFLADRLGQSRVVLLGEADNGGGSDVLLKTRLVKFLHERMGFDVIAFQAGIHSSSSTWRALQAGTDYRSAFQKSIFGALARSVEAESLMQYLAKRARSERPLELVGFDSQFTGTAGGTLFAELQAFLSSRGVTSVFSDSTSPPARVVAGTIAGQFQRGSTLPSSAEQARAADALHAAAIDIEQRFTDPEARRWAQILRSTAVQVTIALDNARNGDAAAYMRRFVRQMGENLTWLLNDAYAGRKVIVWVHTLHAIRAPDVTNVGRNIGHTVGQAVWDAVGPASFAIALTSYDGRSQLVTGAEDYYQDLVPDQHPSASFETLMRAVDHEFAFIDLRAARERQDWPGGRFVASPLHLVPEEAEWSRALDGLLFIRTQRPRTRTQ